MFISEDNVVTLAASETRHLGRGSILFAFDPGLIVLIAKVEHVKAAQHWQRGGGCM